jgi:hypothetical protein
MARKGMSKGAFGGARRGTGLVKVGVGAKVSHFNSKLPGGNGTVKSGRVVVSSNARGHGQHGFGIVTKGGAFRPGGSGRTGYKAG